MKNKSCFFTGHRILPYEQLNKIFCVLYSEAEKLIKAGYIHFYAGGALGFDMLAQKSIIELKRIYPDIKLHVIEPCSNHTRYWKSPDKSAYLDIIREADEIITLSPQYYDGCMHVRNRYMADRCSYLLAYQSTTRGGSAYTVAYAKRQGIIVNNIYDIIRQTDF